MYILATPIVRLQRRAIFAGGSFRWVWVATALSQRRLGLEKLQDVNRAYQSTATFAASKRSPNSWTKPRRCPGLITQASGDGPAQSLQDASLAAAFGVANGRRRPDEAGTRKAGHFRFILRTLRCGCSGEQRPSSSKGDQQTQHADAINKTHCALPYPSAPVQPP